jgi:aspartate beta-hydroxylase
VILLFEIWRPELTEEERRFVSAMFEAIDSHSGEKTAWEI